MQVVWWRGRACNRLPGTSAQVAESVRRPGRQAHLDVGLGGPADVREIGHEPGVPTRASLRSLDGRLPTWDPAEAFTMALDARLVDLRAHELPRRTVSGDARP